MAKRLLYVVLFIMLTACATPSMEQTEQSVPKPKLEEKKNEKETAEQEDLDEESQTSQKLTEDKQENEEQTKKEQEQPEEEPKEQQEAPKQEEDKSKPSHVPKSENKQQTPKSDQLSTSMSTFEIQVVDLVNVERQKLGYSPLKADGEISNIARKKSADLRDQNYFSHQSPTYGSPFDMLKKAQIRFTMAGENIAAGQQSPRSVVEAWMNSEGHRKNILHPDYTHLGVGFEKGGSYGTYWTQLFVRK